jgi:hypothetical protein
MLTHIWELQSTSYNQKRLAHFDRPMVFGGEMQASKATNMMCRIAEHHSATLQKMPRT